MHHSLGKSERDQNKEDQLKHTSDATEKWNQHSGEIVEWVDKLKKFIEDYEPAK